MSASKNALFGISMAIFPTAVLAVGMFGVNLACARDALPNAQRNNAPRAEIVKLQGEYNENASALLWTSVTAVIAGCGLASALSHKTRKAEVPAP